MLLSAIYTVHLLGEVYAKIREIEANPLLSRSRSLSSVKGYTGTSGSYSGLPGSEPHQQRQQR